MMIYMVQETVRAEALLDRNPPSIIGKTIWGRGLFIILVVDPQVLLTNMGPVRIVEATTYILFGACAFGVA